MNKNLILLFGGQSDEHLVSVASAQHISSCLPESNLWFWDQQGRIFEIGFDELKNHQDAFFQILTPETPPIYQKINNALESHQAQTSCFILGLHGGMGENGELQKLFEQKNIKFTGSNSQASSLAFDKIKTKNKLKNYNILLSNHEILDKNNLENQITNFFANFNSCIIKPICGGSSLGVYKILTKNHINQDLFTKILDNPSQKFMIEKIITGTEITISAYEKQNNILALPATEISLNTNHDFDYKAKYTGTGCREITPARIAKKDLLVAQELTKKVHKILNLSGYSRADMILASCGLYFLEINTLPGLTKNSLLPQQLACAGISMQDFFANQISLAVEK